MLHRPNAERSVFISHNCYAWSCFEPDVIFVFDLM